MVRKLGTISFSVSDENNMMGLLRALTKSFESLVATLDCLVDTLSIEDIHARIIVE